MPETSDTTSRESITRRRLLRSRRWESKSARNRSGAALLFCLFIIFVVTLMVVNVLDTNTLQLSAVRNTMEYEQALYLANAGVHHATAMLEANSAWRGTVTDGSYPANDTYSATAVDGADAYSAIVTSIGVAGAVSRTVTAVIEL
jgi:Tfp pilus assembly protein PilX